MHANKWMGKQLLSRRTLLGLFAKALRNEIAELDREICKQNGQSTHNMATLEQMSSSLSAGNCGGTSLMI
jgi:hypothetical protein